MESVKGFIKTISFRNSENWSCFKIVTEAGEEQQCTGVLPAITDVGDSVELSGKTEKTAKYGSQFKCSTVTPTLPDTDSKSGVTKLLQKLPGIGSVKAVKAVGKYGAKKAWLLAQADPERIGVRPGKIKEAMAISSSLVEFAEATIYLLGIGLTNGQTHKIIERYKEGSIHIIQSRPYQLIEDIDGFGFMVTDKIALKSGVKVGSFTRTIACVVYCLTDSQHNQGHIYIYGKTLIGIVMDVLKDSAQKASVSLIGAAQYDEVRKAIYTLETEGKVSIDKGKVFSRKLLDAEIIIREAVL